MEDRNEGPTKGGSNGRTTATGWGQSPRSISRTAPYWTRSIVPDLSPHTASRRMSWKRAAEKKPSTGGQEWSRARVRVMRGFQSAPSRADRAIYNRG